MFGWWLMLVIYYSRQIHFESGLLGSQTTNVYHEFMVGWNIFRSRCTQLLIVEGGKEHSRHQTHLLMPILQKKEQKRVAINSLIDREPGGICAIFQSCYSKKSSLTIAGTIFHKFPPNPSFWGWTLTFLDLPFYGPGLFENDMVIWLWVASGIDMVIFRHNFTEAFGSLWPADWNWCPVAWGLEVGLPDGKQGQLVDQTTYTMKKLLHDGWY